MSKTTPFVISVVHQFQRFAPVTARAMFGGYGLYVEGLMFALIADEQIYLKADGQNQAMFIEAGSTPFIYDRKDRPVVMSYYLLPSSIFDDVDQLRVWLESAIHAARRNRSVKRTKSSSKFLG